MKITTNSKRLYLLGINMGIQIIFEDFPDYDLYMKIEGKDIDALCDFAESTKGRMIMKMFGG